MAELDWRDVGMTRFPWIKLEMEEQARARKLIRQGKMRIVGEGPTRKLELIEK